jgi:putative endonuclease
MVLLDRNWRCELGEIDLVLRDGDVLVVCEVKTRSSAAFGSPFEAVTPAKLSRLRRLAARWVAEREVHVPEVRLDLVGVRLDRRGDARFEHLRGAG